MTVRFFGPYPETGAVPCDVCSKPSVLRVLVTYDRKGHWLGGSWIRQGEATRVRDLCRYHSRKYARWSGYPL